MSLSENIEALLLKRSRSLQSEDGSLTIIPDVTISELHNDRVTVTQHPVDAKANINDHAIIEPPTLMCTFGWSESSSLMNSVSSLYSTGSWQGIETTADIYEKLLSAMNSFTLFDVSTGKRKYYSMIITELKTTTTAETENVLIVDVTFQQINFVSTDTTTLSEAEAKDPWRTSPYMGRGTVSATKSSWTSSYLRMTTSG